MNKRRLLKLADLLEADAANKKGMKFDLNAVAEPSTDKSKMPAVDCGTTGCAMGLAAVSGAFRRAGLGFKIHPDPSGPWEISLSMEGVSVDFDEAAMELFDIDSYSAEYLFDPHSYAGRVRGAKGERLVAKRIRDLVEKGSI